MTPLEVFDLRHRLAARPPTTNIAVPSKTTWDLTRAVDGVFTLVSRDETGRVARELTGPRHQAMAELLEARGAATPGTPAILDRSWLEPPARGDEHRGWRIGAGRARRRGLRRPPAVQ